MEQNLSKDKGNTYFREKNYQMAVDCYTQAISENPTDHTIYGNRSASFLNLEEFEKALNDSQKSIELKPDWSKGFVRKANVLSA